MGSTFSLSSPTLGGIESATVFGFYRDVSSTDPGSEPPEVGYMLDAIDAQECAGTQGAPEGVDTTAFSVVLMNGSTIGMPYFIKGHPNVPPLNKQTELGSASALGPNQCERGWSVFSVPNAPAAAYVRFVGSTASLPTEAEWRVGR